MRALGRRDEAIAALDQALRVEPDYPEPLRVGGLILSEAGRFEAALAFFDRALRSKPDFFDALLDRANLLRQLKQFEEARAAYSQSLSIFPGNVELLNNRGVVRIDIGDFDAALADFDAALAINPDLPEALFNRGTVLLQRTDPEVALAAFDRAVALRPVYPDAWVGRGVALKKMGEMDAALAAFDVALAQNPDSAHALNNKGGLQLLLGDFENGLRGYEYRWMAGHVHKFNLEFPIPEWSGTIRPGEKLIVFDEQGIGDTIQFCRYLPQFAAAGLDITFFCRSTALRLARSLPAAIRCVNNFGPEEHFDSQIALSSLPYAFGTRLSTIPAAVPYLAAEPPLVAAWAEVLAQRGSMQDFKIGLCWAGNPNPRADPRRSIPLEAFLPLMALPGVRVISLQKHHGLEQIAALPQGARLETLGENFDGDADAFIDSAAVMQNLDLIISCDTSVAHLAGALGRPVFVLLKKIPIGAGCSIGRIRPGIRRCGSSARKSATIGMGLSATSSQQSTRSASAARQRFRRKRSVLAFRRHNIIDRHIGTFLPFAGERIKDNAGLVDDMQIGGAQCRGKLARRHELRPFMRALRNPVQDIFGAENGESVAFQCAVERRRDEETVRANQARRQGDECLHVAHMFEDLHRQDDVKAASFRRERFGGGAEIVDGEAGFFGMPARHIDIGRGRIDRHHMRAEAAQSFRQNPGAAANVENGEPGERRARMRCAASFRPGAAARDETAQIIDPRRVELMQRPHRTARVPPVFPEPVEPGDLVRIDARRRLRLLLRRHIGSSCVSTGRRNVFARPGSSCIRA